MLVAAAVLPHPPLLFPEISVRAPEWLVELRTAAAALVRALVALQPDVVVAVGAGPESGEWDAAAGGTMRAYGVDVCAGGRDLVLPMPLTIAARLLDDAGWHGERRYAALASAGAEANAMVGRRLAERGQRVAFLAMGDGSAKRTTEAPGYLDEHAAEFDSAVVAALADVDIAALLTIDPGRASDLWAAGLPAWQALAGAPGDGAEMDARVRYDAAPRGVGYFVVEWTARQPGG